MLSLEKTNQKDHNSLIKGFIILKFLRKLFYLPLVFSLGCTKIYKLNDDDLRWNPYKGGEVLIFKSNRGDVDTIFVNKILREKIVNDELSVFPDYHELLDVLVKHTDPTPPDNHRYLESSFLELFATREQNTLIKFDFAAKGAWFYGEPYNKNELSKLPIQKLSTKNFLYHDVIKLECKSNKYFDRKEFIIALYWSMSQGYIRYDLKNDIYWELQ